ncbi:MAG: mandelate racemase/muconate lactonizing enzyme family protein [Candidatus Tectomicrobia bacterium]|nr:mandelate racemase/muconate lactonizing enzyme family protein [Candidatus Tectomicrobia bacterium]
MKLTGYETLHCDAGWRVFSFLKLTTDEGLTGIAEYNACYGSPGLTGVIERLAAQIVGSNPCAHEYLSQRLYAMTRQAPGGMAQQAIAAIENALLDVKAKSLGVPVYELLGGAVRDRLPLYWSHCGTYRMTEHTAKAMQRPRFESLNDVVALGKEVRDRGFKALKTNIFLFDPEPRLHMPGFTRTPGWPELNADKAVIDALRSQIQAFREGAGPDVGILLDLNFNFKTEGYLRVVRALDDLGLFWFELDLYDPASLRRIRDAVQTPIASCESLFGLRGFKPYFEHYAMDVAIIDVPWNGIWQSMKIAAMAEAYEVNCAPHNFYGNLSTLMSAQLCAAMPNFRIMEIDIDDVPWKDDMLTYVPEIKDGDLIVPSGPGWGAELNEEVIRAHPPKIAM